MQVIRRRGGIRALAGRDRFWLAPSIARLPDDHLENRHVRLMCRYAAGRMSRSPASLPLEVAEQVHLARIGCADTPTGPEP